MFSAHVGITHHSLNHSGYSPHLGYSNHSGHGHYSCQSETPSADPAQTAIFSINVGTTNIDGTGSAINLSDTEDTLTTANRSITGTDFFVTTDSELITISADYWNAPFAKELQITATNYNVLATDFVDVDLNLADSTADIDITINNSKRGEVDTGSGNDSIYVSVQSNNEYWNNDFVINTNAGHDSIIFVNSLNSQFTELDIDAGKGNDLIDISLLNANLISATERTLDGGKGNDRIIGSEGHETIIGGKGNDFIDAGDGEDIIDGGKGNDFIDAGDGEDIIDGGKGNDFIDAGAGDDVVNGGKGNDFIDGGLGADIIDAGAGNDTVVFDVLDSEVDGGAGLDALIISGDVTIVNAENFEVIIGDVGLDDSVTMTLTDGLIVSLGGDSGDELSFDNASSFTASDAVLSNEMIEYARSQNIDVSSLTAYQSDQGETIWSDISLLT